MVRALKLCNLACFSFGSFGFWSAFLAGGDVIASDGNGMKDTRLVEDMRRYMTDWTLLRDPCFQNGTIKTECAKNPKKQGL